MATENSSSIVPSITLPPLTEYPIDGFGGSYYEIQFPVPVYNSEAPNVYTTISWRDIDHYSAYGVTSAIESAIAFALCAATLMNLIVLTPIHKRRLPLHLFLCSALIFQIVRNIVTMLSLSKYVSLSAYCYLTNDVSATSLSTANRSLIAIEQILACLSLVLVEVCFFIQSRGLLSWMRIHHHVVYSLLLAYLVLAGVVATAFRIGLAVIQIASPLGYSERFRIVLNGTLSAHGISIASWSLVSFCSTVSLIFSRRRMNLGGISVYDAALNLIAMVFIESFIVPIILCFMEIFHFGPLKSPVQLILPSVLFLIPLGSLFLTVHDTKVETQDSKGHDTGPAIKDSNYAPKSTSTVKVSNSASDSAVVTNLASPGNKLHSNNDTMSHVASERANHLLDKTIDQYEIELAAIDVLGQSKQMPVQLNSHTGVHESSLRELPD